MSFANILKKEAMGKNTTSAKTEEVMDIISFIESPIGLRFTDELQMASLFPVQKFILKLYYGLNLDTTTKNIRIPKSWKFSGKVDPAQFYFFTEAEYLEYLYNEGRCNIKFQDGKQRRELVLAIGRRSGKSTISAMIAAYETYKLLRLKNPQGYYGLTPHSRIQVCSVAPTTEQSAILYNEIKKHFMACPYFKPYMSHTTQKFVQFQSPHDVEVHGTADKGGISSLRVTFFSSNSKGLRGAANIVAILDEYCFFPKEGSSSDEAVYQSVSPSMATFSPKDPKDPRTPTGPVESRLIMISSPYSKSGVFYEKYESARSGLSGSDDILMIQAPTWEVNPTVPSDFLAGEYKKNPDIFNCEYGAQFSDSVKAWIEDPEILKPCLDPQLKPEEKSKPRIAHFMGLDLAVKKDRTAIALVRPENDKYKLVYHEQWQAGVPWEKLNPHLSAPWFPYAKTLEGEETLKFEAIADWIKALHSRFYITEGLFDQWSGASFEQSLQKRDLNHIVSQYFSKSDSSLMYNAVKQLVYHEKLWLYNYPCNLNSTDERYKSLKNSFHIQELLELEAKIEGKTMVVVEAPQVNGKHDDFSDAFVRAVWLCMQAVGKNKGQGMNFGKGSILAGGGGMAGGLYRGVGFDPANEDNWVNGMPPAVSALPPNVSGQLRAIRDPGSPAVSQRPSSALQRRLRLRR